MTRKCSVFNCRTGYCRTRNKYSKGKYEYYKPLEKIPVYSFPRDLEKCKQWLNAIPNKNLNLFCITEHMGVCKKHFKIADSDYEKKGSTLVPAVPPNYFEGITKSECLPTPKPRKGKATKRDCVDSSQARMLPLGPSSTPSSSTEAGLTGSDPMQRQLPLRLAESLITAVQKRQVLYDIHSEGYKNRNVIELTWKEVAEEVGRDAKYCRTTWSKLRATYNRILSQLKSQSKGSEPSKIPKWYLFHHMSFIKDHVANGTGISNLDLLSPTTVTEEQASPILEFELGEASHASSSIASKDDSLQNEEINLTCEREDYFQEDMPGPAQMDEEVMVKQAKKKRKIEAGHADEIHQAFLELLHAKRQQCQTTVEDSGNDMNFCQGLLPFLKDMTPKNKRIFYQKALTLCNEILDSQDE